MEYTQYEDDWEGYRVYTGEHVEATVQILEGGEDAYIERIDVEEGFRGQGIVTDAIHEIAGDFRRVFSAPDSEDSARLYARLGEKIVGEGAEGFVPHESLYYLDQGFGVYEVA